MNEACTLTITHEETTWENCCPDTAPETVSESCPPIVRTWSKCPTPYTNCGDPSSHKEMCSAELTGYSDSRSLNQKCCPAGYACGSTYNDPCVILADNTTHGGELRVRTNPQYISAPAVFAGCDDASALSPGAVGGIVAVGVISFCFLCGVLLWWIRRSLYRDPTRQRYWRTGERSRITAAGSGVLGGVSVLGMGDTGITITREFRVEEKDGDTVEGEGVEDGRRSGDSTTRIVPEDLDATGDSDGSGGSRGLPLEGTFWAPGERGRSEV
ncbi:unnamed protein product [Tuber aestivum]|uniref:Uncharacterized protein n=1 Tax=Tuber aestivum TaxID=59557 RepID=A0A292PIW1_9PEZI|nr:unnamed protein product [Tuber aestivum]